MENRMFCYQCQEAAGCTGCTQSGVCGKTPEVAAMQDLLIYVTKALRAVTTLLREQGEEIRPEINHMVTQNLFTTITNANFDGAAIQNRVMETLKVKKELLNRVQEPEKLPAAALWESFCTEDYPQKAAEVGVLSTKDEDIRSLRELITYMMEDPRTISHSLELVFVAKSLERVGDHAKNVIEQVVYLVEGRDIRYTPEAKPQPPQ